MAEANEGPKLLKIGDFARRAGTNLRTLRYYEELGLLRPALRSKGGFRYYRETDVNRLAMVQTMQELGLSLERIGELMRTRDQGLSHADFVHGVRAALHEQDRLLAQRQEAIADQRRRVADSLHKLCECEGCPHHPGPHNNFCEPCPVDGEPLPRDLSALF